MNDRFIDGNLIILYALSKSSSTQEGSPEYILNRVRLCLDIHGIIIRSKPDKNRTVVYTVTDLKSIGYIKQERVKRGIGEDKMVIDITSKMYDKRVIALSDLLRTGSILRRFILSDLPGKESLLNQLFQ